MEFLPEIANLGLGGVAIVAIIIVVRIYSERMDNLVAELTERHDEALKESQQQLREIERDFRKVVSEQLSQATAALSQNARIMERVANKLDQM
jgi:DNA-directed RNA polymerase beta' subunit